MIKTAPGNKFAKLNEVSKTSINFREVKNLKMHDYYQSNKSRESSISMRDGSLRPRRASTSQPRAASRIHNPSTMSA